MTVALSLPFPVIVLGSIIGLTYGLLAVGVVLIYRSNRIINFAHGEIGAFSAVLFGVAVRRWHVPYYVGLPLALLVGAGAAALAEVAVIRRLRNAPRLMSIVATLGVGQFLAFFSAGINREGTSFSYPQPPGVPVFDVGALRITESYSGMLFFAPVLVIGIVVLLRRSRVGIGIRAAADNPEAARMAGISAGRMSTVAWALAGAVSAFTAILVLPSRGFTSGESFGPGLLLRALAAAVVARMISLPVALGAGVVLGVIEQVLLWNYNSQVGFVDVTLFAVILIGIMLQPSVAGRAEQKGSWAAVQGWRAVPQQLRDVFVVRHVGAITGGVALVVAAVLPGIVSNSTAIILIGMMCFAMIGLSVGIITGLAGQLSLGQFALAGIGATISFHVASRTGSYPLAFVYAGCGAALVSLVVGLPALRIRGLMLTVTTLAFALMTGWLLGQPWMLGTGKVPGRPIVAGNALDDGRSYYFVVLAVLVLLVLLARNIRRSGLGRLMVAVRDNEDNARAFTVSSRRVKLQAFLLAGFIAGVAGATYGHTFSQVSSAIFPIRANIDVVAMTVIGGVSLLAGPLLGALYTIGVPAFLPLDSAGLAASQLGWLVLIMYLPGGLAQLFQPIRERALRLIARRHSIDIDDDPAPEEAVSRPMIARLADRRRPELEHELARGGELLAATDLRKSFGGVHAVDGVSLHVDRGEILGLIGPNGAGKTTTFEMLGGFTRPDAGSVWFDGTDVSRLGPESRARLGLIRSFQDAALFPTMTVLDTVALALERMSRTSALRSVAGFGRAERLRIEEAREIIALMGLDRYRGSYIQELSTGTRRITEIACLIALSPTLLLLDEPSSGIAQRETEALGALLRDMRSALDLTMIIIEHDIPLIMGLSDRVVAMDTGRVIASGVPADVRVDPRVVEAYLGGSITAIERSGAVSNVESSRRRRSGVLTAERQEQRT